MYPAGAGQSECATRRSHRISSGGQKDPALCLAHFLPKGSVGLLWQGGKKHARETAFTALGRMEEGAERDIITQFMSKATRDHPMPFNCEGAFGIWGGILNA